MPAGVTAVAPLTERTCAPDGTEIAVSVWDGENAGGADVILVHGGAAQRQWWDHLAPYLLHDARRVLAPDLSGHGDSPHRDAYTIELWADEILQVADAFCDGSSPMLVGHSMGGHVVINAAQRAPARYRAVMAMDSPLRRPEVSDRRDKIASRPVKTFPSAAAAIGSYKTYPPVSGVPTEVWAHIAQTAYRQGNNGWFLRFDPRVYRRPQVTVDDLTSAQIPTWWVQAQRGFVNDVMAQQILDAIGPAGSIIRLPEATHHLLLEQPLATAWVINLFIQQHHHGSGYALALHA